MSNTLTNPQNTTLAHNPPAELQSVFDNLALLRPAAVNTLDTGLRGGKVDIPETRALTQQLGEANLAFQKHWLSQITKIRRRPVGEVSVFTPDLLALECFLKINQIDRSAENLFTGGECQTDKHGFITTIENMGEQISDTPLNTEPLERLSGLRFLSVPYWRCDMAKLVKLHGLETLKFSTENPSDITKLASLKLKGLVWQAQPLEVKLPTKVTLDLPQFDSLKTLQTLEIRGNNFSLRSLAPLNKMSSLETLKLYGACIDRDFPRSENLPIKRLEINASWVSNPSWIKYFASLKSLRIGQSDLVCESITYPPELSRLALFNNSSIPYLSAILKPLLKQTKFEALHLEHWDPDKYSGDTEAQEILTQLKSKPNVKVFE